MILPTAYDIMVAMTATYVLLLIYLWIGPRR